MVIEVCCFSLPQVDVIDDTVQTCCQLIRNMKLDDVTDKQLAEYKKRKLITEV